MSDIKKQITSFLGRSTTGALGGNPFKNVGEKFKANALNDLKSNTINPGVLLNRVLNPNRTFGRNIQPESFYSSDKNDIVTDESKLSDYKGLDNDRNHLITFHITNSNQPEILVFRMANFTGFTDSVTITQNPKQYFGRPEPFYHYGGVTRTISFNFDVVVYSEEDVDKIYSKLNTLISLGYPNRYSAQTKMYEPSILKLSIGDYLYKQPFFMNTITFTPDDEIYFFENKFGKISVSIQGNLVQSEQFPVYEPIGRSFIDNGEKPPEQQQIEQLTDGQRRRNRRKARRFERRNPGSDST